MTSETLDLEALLPDLQRLDRKLAVLEAKTSRLGPYDPELEELLPALEQFETRLNRVAGGCHQLHRALRRKIDPDAPYAKSRLPTVLKTLTAPGEGMALLLEANAARLAGRLDAWLRVHPTWEAWAANYRQRQASSALFA